uniref:Uncharacterized protein n=1 Tax=Rhizophora mucronata TaxID=61149 RepID=A0A2P2NFP1_RHIMU
MCFKLKKQVPIANFSTWSTPSAPPINSGVITNNLLCSTHSVEHLESQIGTQTYIIVKRSI